MNSKTPEFINSFFKASLALISAGFINKIIATLSVATLLAIAGTNTYGQFILLMGLITMASTINKTIVGKIYVTEIGRYAAQKKIADAKGVVVQALGLSILVFLFITIFILSIFHFILDFINFKSVTLPEISNETVVLSFGYMFIAIIFKFISQTNYAFRSFTFQARIDVMEQTCRLILILLSYFIGFSLNIQNILLCYTFSLSICIVTAVLIKFFKSTSNFTTLTYSNPENYISTLKSSGFWLIIRNATVSTTSNSRLWILGLVISVEAVAVFSIANRLTRSTKILLPFSTLMNVFTASNSETESSLQKTFKHGYRFAFFFSLIAFILSIAFAPLINMILFPKVYPDAYFLAWILAFVLLIKPGVYSIDSILSLDRDYIYTTKVLIFLNLFMFVSLPFILTLIGLKGIAIEVVFSSLLNFLLIYRHVLKTRRTFDIRFQDLQFRRTLNDILIESKKLLK